MAACVPVSLAPSRWPHRCAVLTTIGAVILLALGATVTTRHAGMADPLWPTYPWHLLLVSWTEPRPGFLIEHTHRLVGYAVGCCGIALMATLWLTEPRRWVRWLGATALAGIIVQGLLGGFRVKLDAWFGTDLAMVHGSFAPVVFCLLTSVAVVTSQSWTALSEPGAAPIAIRRIGRLALFATGLIYLQIVLGSLVRHTYSAAGPRAHLLVAFCVAAVVAWLAREAWDSRHADRRLRAPVAILVVLATVQIWLGIEAWMLRFTAAGLAAQSLIPTAHVLVGYLMLASSLVVTLKAYWLFVCSAPADGPVIGRLEGAA
jgi:cytochrome c oxidase assembly protein subunit 15